MRKLLMASAAAAMLSTLMVANAHAADYTPPPVVEPMPEPVFSWTGFYAGLHAGWAWGDTTATDEESEGSCWNECGFKWSADVDGFVGGGQAGYNWQVGSFVLGAEADVGYLGVEGRAAASISEDTVVRTRGGFYTTVRGRLGFALDRFLVYGTGGWIGADLNSSVNDNEGTTVNTEKTGFQSGWTAGGGVEYAFTSAWSVKGEYLYYDLGKEKVGGVCCGGDEIQFFKIKNTGHIARVGVNYRF